MTENTEARKSPDFQAENAPVAGEPVEVKFVDPRGQTFWARGFVQPTQGKGVLVVSFSGPPYENPCSLAPVDRRLVDEGVTWRRPRLTETDLAEMLATAEKAARHGSHWGLDVDVQRLVLEVRRLRAERGGAP